MNATIRAEREESGNSINSQIRLEWEEYSKRARLIHFLST